MKRVGLIMFVLVLIGALVYLNGGMPRNGPNGQTTPPSTPPAPTQPPAAASPVLPAEEIIGDPTRAADNIIVGWQYDGKNQPRQQGLSDALNAVAQFAQTHKGVSAVIADVDVPQDDRPSAARSVSSLGVFLNGHPVPGLQGNPGSGAVTAPAITRALMGVSQ